MKESKWKNASDVVDGGACALAKPRADVVERGDKKYIHASQHFSIIFLKMENIYQLDCI